MKISYNWLKNYININVEPNKLSEYLTDCGLEVESFQKVESIKGGLKGVIVGEVISCSKHLNADKLSVTTIDIGNNITLPIVCGAPNVEKGQKVLVATVGTILYNGNEAFEIKKSKIRGEISEGMICAEDELGLGKSHAGIIVLENSVEKGTLASEYFKIETDYVFEIGLTPNRADATSHIGTARDLVAVLNRFNANETFSLNKPDVSEFKIDNNLLPIEIKIEDSIGCKRYTGITLKGIKVEDSPKWLQIKLENIGIRPINNIVDITNFVLMENGQPLHAFDYDKIEGENIIIKKLPSGTKFTTLDEQERLLSGNDLMICDAKKPLCLAGIFGGNNSGISEKTTNIFIESAYFDPATIRKSSKYHALQTDASFRFERGADPNITDYALKRAAMLIKEIAGGEIASEIIDIYPTPILNWKIKINYKTISKIIGDDIPKEYIKTIVSDLEMAILNEDEKGLVLEVPTFKVDVVREIDVIEEILRIYGYNNIKLDDHIKSAISYTKKPDDEKIKNYVSDFLVAKGYFETMNNSLSKEDYYKKYNFQSRNSISVLNPLSSELNIMRQDLVFGMLESIIRNINFKNKNLQLFEFGKHYSYNSENKLEDLSKYSESSHLAIAICGNEKDENWKYQKEISDFFTLKALLISIIKSLGIELEKFNIVEDNSNIGIFEKSLTYYYNSHLIAQIGILNKNLLNDFDISELVSYADINWKNLLNLTTLNRISFKELNKFPVVRRDLALLMDKNVRFDDIKTFAYKSESNLLKNVNLFDVYEGKGIEKGKKSYAISFSIQDENKTLTDKQIDKIMSKIVYSLETNLNIKLR